MSCQIHDQTISQTFMILTAVTVRIIWDVFEIQVFHMYFLLEAHNFTDEWQVTLNHISMAHTLLNTLSHLLSFHFLTSFYSFLHACVPLLSPRAVHPNPCLPGLIKMEINHPALVDNTTKECYIRAIFYIKPFFYVRYIQHMSYLSHSSVYPTQNVNF